MRTGAAPMADLNGRTVERIDGHPALLAPRLPGNHPEVPSEAQCRAIGVLARMHRANSELDGPRIRDTVWLEAGRLPSPSASTSSATAGWRLQ